MSNGASHPELPDGWKFESLRDLGAWVGGGTPSKKRSEYWEGGTVPWVSPKDMKSRILHEVKDKITETAIAGSAAKKFDANSIAVVVRSGILEHTLPIALVPFPAAANQDMRVLTPRPDLNPHWVLYALLGHAAAIRQSCSKHGTTVASIEVSRMMAYEIAVPPEPWQALAVGKIERLDQEIAAAKGVVEVLSKKIELLERSVFQGAAHPEIR